MALRPLRLDDIDALLDLQTRSQTHDRYPYTPSRDELIENWESESFDPQRHSRVALNGPSLVGYGQIWHRPSGERLERVHLWGDVDPEHRRSGVGGSILDWQVEASRRLLAESGNDLPKYINVDCYDWCADRGAMFVSRGFEPTRYFEELLRPLDHRPDEGEVEGVAIVAYTEDLDEQARSVKNEAFRDHWGSTPTDQMNWKEWMESFAVRKDLTFLAIADDRVVGVSINAHYPEDAAYTGRTEGWIDALGVLEEYRGKGIASALMRTSMAAFADAGFTHAALGVDSANPTGAADLYRNLGFETKSRSTLYQIEL